MTDKISQQLQEYGISPTNLAKATGVLIGVGYTYTTLLWIFCFYVRPITALTRKIPSKYLQEKIAKANSYSNRSSISKALSANPKYNDLYLSFAEMITIKLMISPVMIPARLWATYEIMKYLNNDAKTETQASN